MEHDEQADRMEEDADKLEQHSEQLGERIDDVQDDWERKEQDVSVPGATARPDERIAQEEEPTRHAREHGTAGGGQDGRSHDDASDPTLGAWTCSGGRSRPGLRRCSPSACCCCS